MLTEKQKKILENRIYSILKESIFENNKIETDSDNGGKGHSEEGVAAKRKSVMKWLDSAQQLHSQIAYKLWGLQQGTDEEKASARSLFSKKYRGHDADSKKYSFTDGEINTLYSIKDRFIEAID